MKDELLKAVEILLDADIIDAKQYTKLIIKCSAFNNSSGLNETRAVRQNEQTKEVCIDGKEHPHHVLYCDKCKNWYNDKLAN